MKYASAGLFLQNIKDFKAAMAEHKIKYVLLRRSWQGCGPTWKDLKDCGTCYLTWPTPFQAPPPHLPRDLFAAQVLSLLPSTSPSCPANCRLRPSLLWEESQADPGVGRNLSRENTKAERGRPCRGFPAGEDPGPGLLGPVSGALGERNPRLCSRPLGTSGARSPLQGQSHN